MITQEVLEALNAGAEVEFYNCRGEWQGIKFDVMGRARQRGGRGGEFEPLTWVNRTWVTALATGAWRLPAEKRDWVGALQWLKAGREVKREGVQGPYARLGDPDGREPSGKLLMWAMRVEDFEAKDWVVAK